MRASIEDLPIKLQADGPTARNQFGWGGMAVAHVELPAGADFTPMLKGLPDDLCHCPHWGHVLKGNIHWRYSDGTEEIVKAGEVFYAPSGHTGWVEEETAILDFSPDKEYGEVFGHITKKMNEQG